MVFFHRRYITESWMLGETACRIFPFFFYGNVAASLFNMVAITLNRWALNSTGALLNSAFLFSFGNTFIRPAVWTTGQRAAV